MQYEPDSTGTVDKSEALALTRTPNFKEMIGSNQNGALLILRAAWDHSANTRGEKTVGHMAEDVIPAYRKHLEENGLRPDWDHFVDFYVDEFNGSERINQAAKELYGKLLEYAESLGLGVEDAELTQDTCVAYVKAQLQDSYTGILVEEVILKEMAVDLNSNYEVSETKQEEQEGIDGYLDGQAVQIKHRSYAHQTYERCEEKRIKLVVWEKDGNGGIKYEYQSSDF